VLLIVIAVARPRAVAGRIATLAGGLGVAAGVHLAFGSPVGLPSVAAVADALEALRVQLCAHLDEEEAEGLPLCAENLSIQEWGALPGHAMASFRGDKIWLILGLIRERMNDGQRAAMLEHMPPPAVEMWTNFGEQAFKELSNEVVVEVRNRVPG